MQIVYSLVSLLTLATPEKLRPSLPVILATDPSGATLPYNIYT
jgi:hypothetical protein